MNNRDKFPPSAGPRWASASPFSSILFTPRKKRPNSLGRGDPQGAMPNPGTVVRRVKIRTAGPSQQAGVGPQSGTRPGTAYGKGRNLPIVITVIRSRMASSFLFHSPSLVRRWPTWVARPVPITSASGGFNRWVARSDAASWAI